MRINFGKYQGSKITTVKNPHMRPTQGRAKSIIFNTYQIKSEDIVLDLFSGTGALGLESLSLGAKKVYFNDKNRRACFAIKTTLLNLRIDQEKFVVYNKNFMVLLKILKIQPTVIFFDPPFKIPEYYDQGLNFIFNQKILDNNGVIILEKMKKTNIEALKLFEIKQRKLMGEKEILFLKNRQKL